MAIITLVVYFFVGVVQDFFFTMNSKYIAQNKIVPAVIYSFLTVFMNMLVLYSILTDINNQTSIIAIVVYSFGIAGGTYVAMKLPKFRKK